MLGGPLSAVPGLSVGRSLVSSRKGQSLGQRVSDNPIPGSPRRLAITGRSRMPSILVFRRSEQVHILPLVLQNPVHGGT